MPNLSDLPAETLHEILIHAVSIRGLKRGLRLRLVNKEFSQEVKNALYQSRVPEDYLQGWGYAMPDLRSPEFDAFWQPYLTNKIIQKRWDDVDLYERIYCTAERLRRISHPMEVGRKESHEITRQYIYVFCHQARRLIERVNFRCNKVCQFQDMLCLLEMALLNDCQEGIRAVLQDPTLDDMISHTLDRSSKLCLHHLASLSAERGNMVLLAKIFLNPNIQQDPNEVRRRAFQGAVREGRLDVVRFVIEPRRHLPRFGIEFFLYEEALLAGVLKSRSVNFCSQLLELLASRLEEADRSARTHFRYDKLLSYVAYASPQRVDVVEWLLKQGASAQLKAHEKRQLMKGIRGTLWDPLGQAVRGGNEKIVRLLLDRGADIRTGDGAFLEDAARQGRLDIVRMLVECGARVRPRLPSTGHKEHWRWTEDMLMKLAVMTENEELCRYLVGHGAVVNDHALKAAVDGSLVSMVELLLELGADVTGDITKNANLLGCSEVTALLQEHNGAN